VILLVSVSARMLAELATRAGHDVVAVDRFGDLDLQRLCPSVSIMRDLGGRGGMAELVDAAERIRAESVVYGAGLENRPDLVARLAAGRTLLGCTPQTLRRVRDPAVLGASLGSAGLAYPRTFSAREAPLRADPPLDPHAGWRLFCWKKAHARAWKTPPREIALARLARAEALGMSYREYTAVLLDTGVHL